MTRLLMCGRSRETLALARELGHEVCAIADPHWNGGMWHDLVVYTSDEQALEAGGFDAAAMAIDDPGARRRVQTYYAAAGVAVADLIGGKLGAHTVHGAGLVLQHLAHLSVDCEAGALLRRVCLGRGLHGGVSVVRESISNSACEMDSWNLRVPASLCAASNTLSKYFVDRETRYSISYSKFAADVVLLRFHDDDGNRSTDDNRRTHDRDV